MAVSLFAIISVRVAPKLAKETALVYFFVVEGKLAWELSEVGEMQLEFWYIAFVWKFVGDINRTVVSLANPIAP